MIPAPPVSGPLFHGGDLTAARARFPDAPEPWIDLSTGINPHPYPIPPLPPEAFTRLPGRAALERLLSAAAVRYGAPSPAHVVAAPGTQSLLPLIARMAGDAGSAGDARVVSPTYAEHARAAALAGYAVHEVARLEDLAGADLAVVVNPNNPDGQTHSRAALLDVARSVRGLLVVDEAFLDMGGEPVDALVEEAPLVVLRSFGKFYGLAGVRLSFAVCTPERAAILAAHLGPWAVSGMALEIGAVTLEDTAWATATRARLAADAARLDTLLTGAGLTVAGGTPLFRLALMEDAQAMHERLARAGILTRCFNSHPDRLRFGLPGDEDAWGRLAEALKWLAF